MPNITTAEAANLIPDLWAEEVLEVARATIVATKIARKDFGTSSAAKGDTIKVPKPLAVTVRDKAEGSPITVEAPTSQTVDVKIDRHKYFSWGVEDNASAKALDVGLNAIREGVPALVEAIEADILAEYVNAATSIGAQGDTLSEALMLEARMHLNTSKAPTSDRFLIVGPESEVNIFTDADLRAVLRNSNRGEPKEGRGAYEDARIGRLYGADVLMSQLIASVAGEQNMLFHKDAIALVTRPLPDPGAGVTCRVITDPISQLSFRYTSAYSIQEQATIHTVDILYGVKTVRPEWITTIAANG